MKEVTSFICFRLVAILLFLELSTSLLAYHHLQFPFYSSSFSSSFVANAQQQQQPLQQGPITLKDMVTYERQSNFIREFKIPLEERGLKGVATDSKGNAWFYHSTNKTSTIIKLDIATNKFTQYNVGGNTTVDDFIINLAGGQLIFDDSRNTLWFTDARTNSIGRLDLNNSINRNSSAAGGGSEEVDLIKIPTPKSGPLGIVLSPDGNNIWFTEITGDRIASLDIKTNKIVEYPTGENTGPTFLNFDKKGMLWVTMSYSHNILRVEPWALIPGRQSFGMSAITLPKSDMFSPFGIAFISEKNGLQKMFVSDHGSSRVVSSSAVLALAADLSSNPLQSYTSYWTSPSKVYPTTLPGQIAADKSGSDIYFPEHGGNRISKINVESGVMTEYDIPTGPLSTAVFIAVSDDVYGKKVWFTEWASNKVAYLDLTVPIPLNLQIESQDTAMILKSNESKSVDVLLGRNKNYSSFSSSSPLSLAEIELSMVGMSDSGLRGVSYTAKPQRINMNQYPTNASQIDLNLEEDQARSGEYTAMIRASASEEKDPLLFVSLLYPIQLSLDVPISPQQQQQEQQQQSQQGSFGDNNYNNQKSVYFFGESLRSGIRLLALPAAIGLISYVIYGRIKRRSKKRSEQQ